MDVQDLQKLVDSLHVSGNGGTARDAAQIDELADAIQNKLGLSLGRNSYREMAQLLASMSITGGGGGGGGGEGSSGASNSNNHNGATTIDAAATASAGTTVPPPVANNSNRGLSAASRSSPPPPPTADVGDVKLEQQQQQKNINNNSSSVSSIRGGNRSPNENAVNTINTAASADHHLGSSLFQSQHQHPAAPLPQHPNHHHHPVQANPAKRFSPEFSRRQQQQQQRGRSPARPTQGNNNITSHNKHRRSSSFTNISCSTNSNNRRGFRGMSPARGIRASSPIRNLWGGGGSMRYVKEGGGSPSSSAAVPPQENKSSPFRLFARTPSSRSKNNKKRSPHRGRTDHQQEEKKEPEKREERPSSSSNMSSRPRRDESPGASPQPRPGRSKSPKPPVPTSHTTAAAAPFQPVSPVPPTARTSYSVPSSPITNRPPSRSSSPFSARPGLQEDADVSESRSISGASPVRSFPPSPGMMAPAFGVAAGPQIPILTSRMPRRPSLGNNNSTDEADEKPINFRRSNSPMPPQRRQPAAATDDRGDLQPNRPRAFSRSPQQRAAGFHDSTATDQIQMPVLNNNNTAVDNNNNAAARPAAGPGVTDGAGLFTPPPRMVSLPRATDPMSEDSRLPESTRRACRPNGTTPAIFASGSGDVQFHVGQKPRTTRRQRFSNNTETTPQNTNRSPPREKVYTPMEVDPVEEEMSPPIMPSVASAPMQPAPAPQPPAAQQAPFVDSQVFKMGTAGENLAHAARRRRRCRIAKKVGEESLPRSAESSFSQDGVDAAAGTETTRTSSASPIAEFKAAFISSKREEAKNLYIARDFKSSITSYAQAIKAHTDAALILPGDTLAVLLSNRAAGLLMVGAFEAAVSDCQQALQHVTNAPQVNVPFSNDSGMLLKIKLHTRMARGYLKLGNHAEATTAFQDAVNTATEALAFSEANHAPSVFEQNKQTLDQMLTEATLGQSDAKRLKDACDDLTSCTVQSLQLPSARRKYAEALQHVNIALSMASGSASLTESKVAILATLKRWRELGGFCERLAAINVSMDDVFVEDLTVKNPFPGVPPSKALKADFFAGARDEDPATRDLKLGSKAVAEAVLRLPYSLNQYYLRSLRLEERYHAAEAALRSLQELVNRMSDVPHFPRQKFSWLVTEQSKLERTKRGREQGDEYFRLQDYDKAAVTYIECLGIDAHGSPDTVDGPNAGGRVHAVLHCNRAACLMALRRFHGAIEECSNALKIHSRYMKAILRRARCYTRLQRTLEAISEYKRWLDYIEEAKKSNHVPSSPNVFDGPHSVLPPEVEQVKKELEEVYNTKRRTEASAREEAARRRDRERDFMHGNYSTSWGSNARDRRDQWYAQSNSRRWDSFANRGPRGGPRSSSNPRPGASFSDRNTRSSSQGRPRQPESAESPRSSSADHYAILGVARNASDDQIKKAYRKKALKYHPDKNQGDEGAVENFRRIKLAQEILVDPVKRREYDAQLRLSRFA